MEGSSSSKREEDDNNKKKPWSRSEDKVFESALANLDENDKNWSEKIAALLPGRSPEDVIDHLLLLINDVINIERGLIELPKYPDDDSDSDSDSDSDPQQHNRFDRLRIGDATSEEIQQSQEMKQEESTGNAVVKGTTKQSQEMKQEGTSNVEEEDAERTN